MCAWRCNPVRGTTPAERVERLEGLGAWIGRHSDAVYGTVRSAVRGA
ncbi:hypothetical protein WBG99_32910 [Streptomyces sp. TG1A-60]